MSRFEIKIVVALLLIAVIPLVASVILVDQVIRVSDSVAEGQTLRMAQPLARAADAYRDLFESRKQSFLLQAKLIAIDSEIKDALKNKDLVRLQTRLNYFVKSEKEIGQLSIFDKKGSLLSRVLSKKTFSSFTHRDLVLDVSIDDNHKLECLFFTPQEPFEHFKALDSAQRMTKEITSIRGDLNVFYRVAFFVMFGVVLLLATALGIFIARRTTKRVAILASATRGVAAGDLNIQVESKSKDELGQLAESFNEMVRQLKEHRERIGYLEKIGAWQEIARRLAHEIKNPLTPIQLAVQQLDREYHGDDKRFRKVLDDAKDIITEEVDGLRRLVHAFSAFAKLPSVRPEKVQLNAVVDDFLKSHADLVERAHVTWTPPKKEVLVFVDRMLMKHVLYNLVENAAQACEAAGRDMFNVDLSVVLDFKNNKVRLTVSDNGPGMDSETLSHVFEPYYTNRTNGTGLGLAIVKKIILEHSGSIGVESKTGKGSRFKIALPFAEKAVIRVETKS